MTLTEILYAPSLRLNLAQRFAKARALARQRQELAKLSDEALRDIGLTRAQATREALKSSWNAPDHWKH